jgi:FkbM family methyltransferase
MAKKKTVILIVALLLSVSIASVFVGYVGPITDKYNLNLHFCNPGRFATLRFSLSEVVGLIEYHAQLGQDRWIVQCVFPGVEDGYFVDVGSGDGVWISNTKVLEDLGWNGICIDPFPTNMENRTCAMFKEVVYSEAGHKVRFRAAEELGGIEEHLKPKRWREGKKFKQAKIVEFTTTTLDEILARANAPNFIHYMSIDIEGAELEALKGFSFSKYKVGALTIEHNNEEPKRSQIRMLLESKGYRLEKKVSFDDWYVLDQSRAQ